MVEAELIKKIQTLKQIRPSKNWVLLTKKELFREEPDRGPSSILVFLFRPRFVFASLVFLLFLTTGTLSLAQKSLPGDFLYPVKRVAERGRAIFVAKEDQPQAQLEVANKRLEELTKIAEQNQVQRLAPAINEFQSSASKVAKNLKEPKKLTKEVVQQAKKLTENKEKVEALGIVVGETEELDASLKELVEREIKDLESRSLTEDQEALLNEAKNDLVAENFTNALEKIWLLSNQ